jgi:hypothetical protein
MAERAKLLTRDQDDRPRAPQPSTIASWQAQMRRAMFEALDEDAVRDIVAGLVEKARKGDLAAARLVLTYAIGSPTVVVKNATISAQAPPPLPQPPSKAAPGSDLRMVDMGRRAAAGLPLHDPRDRGHGDDD